MKKIELKAGMMVKYFSPATCQVESVVVLVVEDECLFDGHVIVLRRGTRDVVSTLFLKPLNSSVCNAHNSMVL